MENKNSNKNIDLKFKDITNKLLIGIDIGGSLTKVCVLCNKTEKSIYDFLIEKKIFEPVDIKTHYLFLTRFLSVDFEKDILPILEELNNIEKITKIEATGGGAFKFCDVMKKVFNIEFIKHDELLSLVNGYLFMNTYNSFYEAEEIDSITPIPPEDFSFPHICVNIGSGVSILKVKSPTEFERVGGTLMGGGTLIGLSKLIMGIDSYNEILELAGKGNYKNVDLTVKDIYRGEEEKYKSNNLPENTVASSFGKIHEFIQSGQREKIKNEDIALSLLTMICFHITQYAVIHAKENNIDKIYYFGNFTRRNSRATFALAKASKYWNKNIKVRFNYYDGYFGAVGALLETNNIDK